MKLFNQTFINRPKSLGEGLLRVKKQFNVVGTDLINKPGNRLYKTINNNRVAINTTGDKLEIRKHLNLQTISSYKNYLNKLAGIEKFYNKTLNNTENRKTIAWKRIFSNSYVQKSALNKYYTDIYVSNYNKYFDKNISSADVEIPSCTAIEKITYNKK